MSSSSSSSSWQNLLQFSVGFVLSSAVLSANIAVPANRKPDVVQPEGNDGGGGVLDVAWGLLRYAASGEVLAIGRSTVRRDPSEETHSDVNNVLRKRVDELNSHSDQLNSHSDQLNSYSFPPKTHSQDPNSDAPYRTDTDDDDVGTSWYDDRYQSTVQQQRVGLRGVQRLPQAIIIGVKKGGTRALLEFLRTHPDVRAPGPEIHFFDKNYHRGLDWYRSQMPATLPGQITVEKTPSYWITRDVPARIFNMSRDVRLVVVVRDPATRALSDYAQAMTKRPDVGPFERLAFLDGGDGLVDTSWGAIRIGLYARHLERWLRHFPRPSIHFVSGERLVSDPAAELGGVQDFLRLKRVVTDKHFFFNATKGFPCLKKAEGSGGSPRCLGKTKGRPHPRVDEKVLRRLRDFYRPFNERFYRMTGINFNWP